MAGKTMRDRYYELCEKWLGGVVVGLTILLIPIILIPEFMVLPTEWVFVFWVMDWFIWSMFVVELVVMLALTRDRHAYIHEHILDVVIVVLSVPVLVSYLRFERLLRLGRLMALLFRGIGRAGVLYVRSNFSYVLAVTLGSIVMMGIVAAHLERGLPGSNIQSADVGIWWAVSTVTTVGYGDFYPVSWGGRVVGIILMLLGIAAYSVLVANVSGWFLGADDRKFREEIHERLERLETLLLEMKGERK